MDINLTPTLNLEFDNIIESWEFWRAYGRRIGFSVRKHKFNRSKKDLSTYTSYLYVCNKEGVRKPNTREVQIRKSRDETRTSCEARMKVKLVDGKYRVSEVFLDHNHPLQPPEAVHLLASHRELTKAQRFELENAEKAGINQKSAFNLQSQYAGGRDNLGYTRVDVKNYRNSRRQQAMKYGEDGCIFRYFEQQLAENPSFFHSHQMDSDEQVTNVFWADARMLVDYACFGEVISLDTTYCTNNNHRPLAIFSGFNHYKGGVIFGVALLYDETIETFKWLFNTFLQAHKNARPVTIFTDQDAAMVRALQEVMPHVKHALCTWHISRNAMKHLLNSLVRDFNHSMYHCWEEIEFEEAWQALLSKQDIVDNSWLMYMYQIKEKWAACYLKNSRTLGMRSTQISESVNASVKSCTNVKLDINRFFQHFEQVLEDKRYNELKRDFEARDKLPRLLLQSSCMLRQLSDIYTRPIFDLFQYEYDLCDATCIKERKERKKNESEEESATVFDHVIIMYDKKREYSLTFDPSMETITCSCKKFEQVGILCCHALRVLNERDVKLLPQKYIMKRWTREARCGVVHDIKGKEIEVDPKLQRSNRYRQLCPLLVKLASDASESPEAFSLVHESVLELSKKVTELHIKHLSDDSNGDEDGMGNHHGGNSCGRVVGFKKRYGRKISKRIKSCVEIGSKRRRTKSCRKPPQVSQPLRTSQHNQLQISGSSTQTDHNNMMLDNSQPSEMTYTDLLIAPLECDITSLETLDFSQTYNAELTNTTLHNDTNTGSMIDSDLTPTTT